MPEMLKRKICFLLLLFMTVNCQADLDSAQQLIEQSKQRQEELANRYGFIESALFEHMCSNVADQLALNHKAMKKLNSCRILNADFPNAYSFADGSIIFTKGMLLLMKNQHQFASVLAHEWAHIALHHHQKIQKKVNEPAFFFTKSRLKKLYRKQEDQADQWSDKQLKKHGFDAGQITPYLIRLMQQTKHKEKSSDHRKLKKRIKKNLTVKELKDETFMKMLDSLSDS